MSGHFSEDGYYFLLQRNKTNDCICYEIQDKTGMMDVLVYGRLTSVEWNPGDKLRLLCFELTSNEGKVQLRSMRHSNMKVCTLEEHPPSQESCF